MCALRPGQKQKSVKPPLLAQIADQSAFYQPLLNFGKIVFDQIQLTTDFQHDYRELHSTSTALTQMTDDWLRINYKKVVGLFC